MRSPGVGIAVAQVIIAEVGIDMTRFPTPNHLGQVPARDQRISRPEEGWQRYRAREPLSRPGPGRGRCGCRLTKSFLGERYRRIARRRGKKRAIVAVGRSILMIVWELLNDVEKRFVDLGPGYDESRVNRNRSTRNHVRELQALGYRVILEPAA